MSKLNDFLKRFNYQQIADFFLELDNSKNFADIASFYLFYSSIYRRYGIKLINVSYSKEEQAFLENEFPLDLRHLSLCDLMRIVILTNAKSTYVKEVLLNGDDKEQATAIYSLLLLDNPQQYKDDVVNSCRTNSSIVFSAISQNNPYAKIYFEDKEFFQLCLKTIFIELDFSKIIGINTRANNFFDRQLLDLYKERTSANRLLPSSVINFMKNRKII